MTTNFKTCVLRRPLQGGAAAPAAADRRAAGKMSGSLCINLLTL
jgi:hypothetical protein